MCILVKFVWLIDFVYVDDPQSQKIQKVILKSPEKMKPAGFKEEGQ